MRLILSTALIMLGACAARAPVQPADAVARVDYAKLALADGAGRAELRRRVALAVQGFCKAHGGLVTPDALKTDKFHCMETVRRVIVAEMPREVRRAYWLALREAGIRGRRL